jgi:ketosteroid isomerase-like protein
MDTQAVAKDFTALCAAGKGEEAGAKYWSDDVVSIENMPGDMQRLQGRKAVKAKGDWWVANHEVHKFDVTGPYVNGDQFAVRFNIDVTPKGGQRMQMEEIGLYTVRGGKIVEERFLY